MGVSIGEKINAKNPIGMVSNKENIKIYIQQNGNIVKISEIQWKN